ncbi:MAG: P1 family peptidase [Anaerolineae bacterium]|nr:P1 family peptidase [Anaerolineae bacterium]
MSYKRYVQQFNIIPGTLPTGPQNALTDVPGVLVGHTTRVEGDTIRTGVTAIKPHAGNIFEQPVTAAVHTINGFGKATAFEQIREQGVIETPIILTNTLSVWRAADALVSYMLQQTPSIRSVCPVVGECNDAYVNDIRLRSITEADVFAALESAHDGPVEQGSVGGGTGTTCYGFKGGIGTSSRVVNGYTFAILLQTNFGDRTELRMGGADVGWQLRDKYLPAKAPSGGSIMIILATDAPMSSRQLGRLARRVQFGLGRTGSTCTNGSGEFVIAFTTDQSRTFVRDDDTMNAYFGAVVDCAEESIYNALLSATTVTGLDGHTLYALPHDELGRILGVQDQLSG